MRSTWCRALLAAGVLCAPAVVLAGEPGRVELGVVPFDFSVISAKGETNEAVTLPGGGYLTEGSEGVYLQWLVTDRLAIEPQASLTALFYHGDNFRTIRANLRVNYLFAGADRPSAYVFAGGGLVHMGQTGAGEDNSSETDPRVGVGVGYRQPVRSAGSVRVEVGYQRILVGDSGDDITEFSFRIGLGLRF
jgi:hypothetical protein